MNLQTCIEKLTNALPDTSWSQDPERIIPHLVEWRGRWHGNTPLLLTPATSAETALIVRICANHQIPITTQGGNTGLVGGQIPQGEILLSTTKLTQIRVLDRDEKQIVCEAGLPLQAVQEAAETVGAMFPLSLASEGTCTIGGTLSTNAGGVHVLKYGTAKTMCLGVEAVMADGSLYRGLHGLKKDNTGYDLSRLFLGAEGTLGIITAARLQLVPKPAHTDYALVSSDTLAKITEFLWLARQHPSLSMFEFFPDLGMELVIRHMKASNPFSKNFPWYVLLEWESVAEQSGQPELETMLQQAMDQNLIQDAVLASSDTQAKALLGLRENLSAAQKPEGVWIKHDISVPIAKIPEFVELADEAVQTAIPNCRPLAFGHVGDGNVHYNIGQPVGGDGPWFLAQEPVLNELVYDIVDALGGSISAEHGIGILKKHQLIRRADPQKIKAMMALKHAFDPDNILNPRVLL
jgi:FAD/FMN-containing dehydrogenase